MEQKKLNIVRLVVLSVGGQKELAKRLGITQQYVSKWCQKGVVPKKWANQVAQVTGFDSAVLTGRPKE